MSPGMKVERLHEICRVAESADTRALAAADSNVNLCRISVIRIKYIEVGSGVINDSLSVGRREANIEFVMLCVACESMPGWRARVQVSMAFMI